MQLTGVKNKNLGQNVLRSPRFRKTTHSSWFNTGGFVGILHDSPFGLPITVTREILIAKTVSRLARRFFSFEMSLALLRWTEKGDFGGNRGSEFDGSLQTGCTAFGGDWNSCERLRFDNAGHESSKSTSELS